MRITGTNASEVNAQLHAQSVPSPIVFVLVAEAMNFASALALGQRTAGRRIAGYCLMAPAGDTSTPDRSTALPPSSDWPDAPVCVAALQPISPAVHTMARLHGWELLTADLLPDLAEAISQWSRERRNDL